MINEIITTDINSSLTYSVTNLIKGVLYVSKNVNSSNLEPYEGICPQGVYQAIPAVFKVGDSSYSVTSFPYQIEVSKKGRVTIKRN